MPLSLNLREYRVNAKLTLNDLSRELGVTSSAISQWETGKRKPDIKALVDIANALNVTPNDLLGFSCGNAEHK